VTAPPRTLDIPPDVLSGTVTYTVDDQARPGDVVVPLVALLISMARRRQAEGPAATDTEVDS